MTNKNLVAVTPGGGITEDMLAGEFFWYSIPDAMVALSRVRKAFKEAGLDETRLPTERRPEHVAQEACRKAEKVITNGRRIEIRAEQVDRNQDFLIYQITRHVQDKANRVIEHPKALRVLFAFADSSLSFEALDPGEEVQEIIEEIQAHFDKNSTKMPGHKLRTLLRHYVEAVGAENMRGKSGGVYFIAKSNPIDVSSKLHAHHGDVIDGREFLTSISTMLTSVYGRDPEFHRVPCVNDEGQREYLKRKFIENCQEDLEEYRNELLELVRGKDERKRGFRSDARANLIARRKQIDARRQKFAAILGETMEELDRNMELADKALAKFIKEADNA